MSSTTRVLMIADIPDDIRESIYDHVFSSDDIEVGGVLVGTVDESGTAHIDGMIAALEAEGSRASVTFTHDAWEQIIEIQERDFPNSPTIVGWYHSHPGFGVFLSEHDMFIHENFFTEPYHAAYVVDPQEETEGMFGWQDNRVVMFEEGRTPRRRGKRRPTIVVDVEEFASEPETTVVPVVVPAADEPRTTIMVDGEEEEPRRRRRRAVPLIAGALLVGCVAVVVSLGNGSSKPTEGGNVPKGPRLPVSDPQRTASMIGADRDRADDIAEDQAAAYQKYLDRLKPPPPPPDRGPIAAPPPPPGPVVGPRQPVPPPVPPPAPQPPPAAKCPNPHYDSKGNLLCR